jgi:hypothetical protein
VDDAPPNANAVGSASSTNALTHTLARSLPLAPAASRTMNIDAAGMLHMARVSRANYEKCIDLLKVPLGRWAGVRYLRVALRQKRYGKGRIDLGGEEGDGEGDGGE